MSHTPHTRASSWTWTAEAAREVRVCVLRDVRSGTACHLLSVTMGCVALAAVAALACSCFASATAAAPPMRKVLLNVSTGARCLDGSPA